MNELSFREQLTRVLDAQHKLSDDLLNLLQQEYDALCGTNVEILETISAEKRPIVTDLENLGRAWEVLLKNKGIELTAEGILQFLIEFDAVNSTELADRWQQLRETAKSCQKKNTVNGSIVAMRHQSTQQIINLLHGRTPEERLYNNSGGESSTYSGGNSLAKA